MKVLVIGSSHINSLRLSESFALNSFCSKIVYSACSIGAWLASNTVVSNGCIQLSPDPEETFSKFSPLPNSIRQLNQAAILADFDSIILGQVGTIGIDRFFSKYKHPKSNTLLNRAPISQSLLDALLHPVNGDFNDYSKISWRTGESIKQRFSTKNLLSQIQECAPTTKKIYVSVHPIFRDSNFSDSELNILKTSRDEYYQHWRDLTSRYGFEFVSPPIEAIEDNLCFTRLDYSINPEKHDLHLNERYGLLLWKKIQALI